MRVAKLDAVRGVAAMAVVLGHAIVVYKFSPAATEAYVFLSRSPIGLLWDAGSAVTIFFILSGYVLSLPYLQGRPPSYRDFIIRRICRIYLPFAAIILLVAPLIAATPHIAVEGTRPGLLKYWGSVDFTAFAHTLAMTGRHNVIDPPIWSLIEEMRISLIFPLLVFAVVRLPWPIAIVLALGFSVVGSRLASMDLPEAIRSLGGTTRWVVLFVVGSVLAKEREAVARLYAATPMIGRIALLIFAYAFWYARYVKLPLNIGLYLPWLSMVVLFVVAIHSSVAERVLGSRLLQGIGHISYSLYLVHLPVLVLTTVWLTALPVGARVLLAPPLAIAFAFAFCRLVEEPCMRLGRRLTAPRLPA